MEGEVTAPEQGPDPYIRARDCEQKLPRLLEIAVKYERLQGAAKEALDVLTRLADEIKDSATVGGEWDGSEDQAREEYDRIMAVVETLKGAWAK